MCLGKRLYDPLYWGVFMLKNEKNSRKSKNIFIFLCRYQKKPYLCTAFQNDEGFRAFSSAGSEHLPYKQRVGGSNPSTPTIKLKLHRERKESFSRFRAFSSAGSEHLPYKQRVGGSNPSTPTQKSTDKWTFFFIYLSISLVFWCSYMSRENQDKFAFLFAYSYL